jgi:hypothetical protein
MVSKSINIDNNSNNLITERDRNRFDEFYKTLEQEEEKEEKNKFLTDEERDNNYSKVINNYLDSETFNYQDTEDDQYKYDSLPSLSNLQNSIDYFDEKESLLNNIEDNENIFFFENPKYQDNNNNDDNKNNNNENVWDNSSNWVETPIPEGNSTWLPIETEDLSLTKKVVWDYSTERKNNWDYMKIYNYNNNIDYKKPSISDRNQNTTMKSFDENLKNHNNKATTTTISSISNSIYNNEAWGNNSNDDGFESPYFEIDGLGSELSRDFRNNMENSGNSNNILNENSPFWNTNNNNKDNEVDNSLVEKVVLDMGFTREQFKFAQSEVGVFASADRIIDFLLASMG